MNWNAGFDPYNIATVPRRPRTVAASEAKLIVCHDMMGGYAQDQHPQVGICQRMRRF